MDSWKQLNFWQCGEWDVIQDNLREARTGEETVLSVQTGDSFQALDLCDFRGTKVVFLNNLPYSNVNWFDGLAFSVLLDHAGYPAELATLFRVYTQDLHYDYPTSGSLRTWASRGVLLWNIVQTCEAGKASAHEHWPEWHFLTKEIIEQLSMQGTVFVLFGSKAKSYEKLIDPTNNWIINAPNPGFLRNGVSPLNGTRFYSTINARLVEIKKDPVDWKL